MSLKVNEQRQQLETQRWSNGRLARVERRPQDGPSLPSRDFKIRHHFDPRQRPQSTKCSNPGDTAVRPRLKMDAGRPGLNAERDARIETKSNDFYYLTHGYGFYVVVPLGDLFLRGEREPTLPTYPLSLQLLL